MMGSRYRLSSGLPLLPVSHSTAVMNTTIDQDSISSRVRVRPGKKRRERKTTMAAVKAASEPVTAQVCETTAPDHTRTSAASARQRISIDWVLRTGDQFLSDADTAPRALITLSCSSARFTSGSRSSSGASAAGGGAGPA